MSKEYKQLKNYIHNDIKITKEDIKNIIEDIIKVEINRLLRDKSYIDNLIIKEIRFNINRKDSMKSSVLYCFNSFVEDEIMKTIHKEVKDKLVIKFKEENNE